MEDLSVLITGGVGLVSSTISAIISWLLARRKYNSEVDTTLIENMQKSLEFYKTLVDDNKERLDEVLKRNDALEDEIRELRKQMFDVMTNICYNITCTHRQLTKEKNGIKASKKIQGE